MWPARSARAGIRRCTSALAATSACVVIAPIFTVLPLTLMPLSSAMPPRSISASGAARPRRIDGSSDCPPATSLDSSFRAAAAAATLVAVW